MQIDQSNRTNFNDVEKIEEVVPHSNETEELLAPNPEMQNSISSSFNPSNLQMHAQATDTTSSKTAQASEFKNAESGACWQVKSSLYTFNTACIKYRLQAPFKDGRRFWKSQVSFRNKN